MMVHLIKQRKSKWKYKMVAIGMNSPENVCGAVVLTYEMVDCIFPACKPKIHQVYHLIQICNQTLLLWDLSR